MGFALVVDLLTVGERFANTCVAFADSLDNARAMKATTTGPQWARLGKFVRERRTRLGLSQRDVAERGGPSDTTQQRIEAGEWRPGRGVSTTLEKLDRGLGWKPGSASRILAGGEPVTDDETADDVIVFDLGRVPTEQLMAELLRRIPGPRGRIAGWTDREDAPPL